MFLFIRLLFKSWALLSFTAFLFTVTSHAAIITFDLRDTLNTAAIESGSFTQSDLTIILSSNQGVLNQTASSFGVNHPSSGDATSLLDGVNGAESINISFDQTVNITSLTLSSYASGGAETASLTIASFSPIDLVAQATSSDVYNFSTNNVLNTAQIAQLSWLSGNGFSFDSITVETIASVVPEPNSILLLGLSGIIFACYRSRRTPSKG